MATSKTTNTTLDITSLDVGTVEFCILGKTPLIHNRMSEKARRELLMPKGKKTAAQKKQSLKHNPFEEFAASPYVDIGDGPTYITFLATAFKAAIRGAGIDVPGATKAQLGRLMWVEGERLPVYGTPRLFMAITRNSDINKTPDVRTRAIMPEWACRVTVSFVKPILNVKTVGNLLAGAGLIRGVGDWRTEKGSGNYGQFEVVDENNDDFVRICREYGRDHQIEAINNPVCYDHESEDLLDWWRSEAEERGLTLVGGRDVA